jgi:hypothetical protein
MEMAGFKQSVVINRPVDQVFSFVSDLENDPPWTAVAEMRRTSPGPLGVGTTFRQRDRILGRRLDLSLEVVGYEPNHRITLKTTSDLLSFAARASWSPSATAPPASCSRAAAVLVGCSGGPSRCCSPSVNAACGPSSAT